MRILLILIILSIVACEQVLINDEPENNFENNFDLFWNEFDQHYPFFELKNIDWDSVYEVDRPIVETLTNASNLLELMGNIALKLKDGHVELYAPTDTVRYDYSAGFPKNSPNSAISYLEQNIGVNEKLSYGCLKNSDLGYIRIRSFQGSESQFNKIDEIVNQLKDKTGIVIDVRSNLGGTDIHAKTIASRFADERRLFRKTKLRKGPVRSEFTEWLDDFIEPSPEGSSFLKPVIVLTNRECYSATEGFILAMKSLPNVRTAGGITGGGSGNPIFRELPIGWIYKLSTWLVASPDNIIYEGIGIPPDVALDISESDVINRKDVILEKAMELLQ